MTRPKYRILRFYKPYGVLTKFTDAEGRPTLADYVDVPNVYPVGRLDMDSEGLLILTDFGLLNQRLTDPAYRHPRTYLVQIERIPDEAALEKLRAGVVIEGKKTLPTLVELLDHEPDLPPRDPPVRFRKSVPTAFLKMTLYEGRNRQVRKMTAAVGHPTLRLMRMSSGPIKLEGLQPGEWRDLTEEERATLLKSIKLKG
ncbi:MAG: pseudouridine synthase [Anaerolineae bacterium]|nr:pseudouridine synthase [Anaerolineae bacterium]